MAQLLTVSIAIDTEEPFCQEFTLTVDSQSTIAMVLQQFCQQREHTLALEDCCLGVFGRPATLDDIVQHNDRIEVYSPLRIDPKQARRIRAQKQRNQTAC